METASHLCECPNEAEIADLDAAIEREKSVNACITHYYDIGDQKVFIKRTTGNVDAKKAAIYCQFKCEEWFGSASMLTNLGVASLLVAFYGFQQTNRAEAYTIVDMHADRERMCGPAAQALLADVSLYRDGLREAMAPHVLA